MKKVVNAIILDSKNKKVLLIKRKGGLHPGKWAFPGGIIEKGETTKQALIRESREEINLEVEKIIKKIGEYEYLGENQEKTIGKSYLVNVKNFNIKINSEEISEFKWVTIEELENLDHIEGMEEEIMKAIFESTK